MQLLYRNEWYTCEMNFVSFDRALVLIQSVDDVTLVTGRDCWENTRTKQVNELKTLFKNKSIIIVWPV